MEHHVGSLKEAKKTDRLYIRRNGWNKKNMGSFNKTGEDLWQTVNLLLKG